MTTTTSTELSHRERAIRAVAAGACDRCSAAAQYRALLRAGELLFCGHHARRYRPRLLEAGARLSSDPGHTTPDGRHALSRST